MKALGFQVASTTSGQRKQYTAIVLENGVILKHFGGRDANHRAAFGRIDVSSTTSIAVGISNLKDVFNAKAGNSEYDQLLIAFEVVDLPVDAKASIDAIEASGRSLLHAFRDAAPVFKDISTRNRKAYHYTAEIAKFLNGSTAPKATVPTPASTTSVPAQTFYTKVEKKILRPNGEQYHPREIMGHTDVALLREFRKNGIYVRLAGPPGGGKTAMAEAAYSDIITVNGHGDMTVANFVGNHLPDPAKPNGWIWQDGPLVRAMKEGKVLFVDEGTRIPTEVLNILFSVMDGRGVLRIDDRPDLPLVQAHKDFYVIMGYNPETLGARALDEALISRFRIQIEVTTNFTTAKRLQVPDLAIKIARNLDTRNTKDLASEGPGVWVPQMRELITFRDLIKMGAGEDFALATLVAACPRPMDVENVREAIQQVAKKNVKSPTLGGLV